LHLSIFQQPPKHGFSDRFLGGNDLKNGTPKEEAW
jgi:hypothetical protein